MDSPRKRPGGTSLLEREDEVGAIEAAVERARGDGALLVIAGPAGSGKSALLRQARDRAQAHDLDAYDAGGSELERGFAFGVARQLFERPLMSATPAQRASLLGGAAAIAGVLLGVIAGEAPSDGFAAMHGLYWLLATLADRRPVLLTIDDGHWADAPSLRWLSFVARRLHGLRVLIVVATRESAGGLPPEVGSILAETATTSSVLRPRPLSVSAVGALVGRRLGSPPDERFVAACHQATGGNAFVVHELAESLAADGIRPDAINAGRVQDRAPETVARSVLHRLARLGDEAAAVGRALAVRGEGRPVREYARLAGVSVPAAERAGDALAAADLAGPTRPLRFAHPLVRAAVYGALAPGERSAWHARAAAQLTEDGADPEAVGMQLLQAEPQDDAAAVQRLRDAAEMARVRGAPEAAVVYLRRALDERAAAEQPRALWHELGRAELLARDPSSVARLVDALGRETDPCARARIGLDAADALLITGHWSESLELAERLRGALGEHPEHQDLALRLDAWVSTALLGEQRGRPPIDVKTLSRRATSDRPAGRPLCLQLACALALRGARAPHVVELVQRGYADGAFFSVETSDHPSVAAGAAALIHVDEVGMAARVAEGILADARRRGLVLGYVAGTTYRGLAALRSGRLADAEADLGDALERALDHRLAFTTPFIAGYLASTLRELGRLDDAAAIIGSVPPPDATAVRPAAFVYHESLGRLHAAAGRRAQASAELRRAGDAAEGMHATSPTAVRWRSLLALTLGPDDRGEAERLASEELTLARAAGVATGIGVAERAVALTGPPERRLGGLRDAVASLRRSPARVDLAEALVDLGVELVAASQRAEARTTLTEALDLAHRCGAAPIAQRAREGARAAGSRPRRSRTTGVEALTASELRAARLAAQGLSNREIAEMLFVTIKTVKDHLGNSYRKLQITSRRDLPRVLGAPQPELGVPAGG